MRCTRRSETEVSQRRIFLEEEGNAWHQRNSARVQPRKLPDEDPVLREVLALAPLPASGAKILEIGCGEGTRLSWLKDNRGFETYGLDPSIEAVKLAQKRGVNARQGTADSLPF